jgi:hypothetical protein
MGRHGVAVGFNADQTFPTHHHTVEEAVIVGLLRQRTKFALLLGQSLDGNLTGGITRALGVDLNQPLLALLGQVSIVVEGASTQKIGLDEFDQLCRHLASLRTFVWSENNCPIWKEQVIDESTTCSTEQCERCLVRSPG